MRKIIRREEIRLMMGFIEVTTVVARKNAAATILILKDG